MSISYRSPSLSSFIAHRPGSAAIGVALAVWGAASAAFAEPSAPGQPGAAVASRGPAAAGPVVAAAPQAIAQPASPSSPSTSAPPPYEVAPAPPPPPNELPARVVSLTFSPLHLLLPVAEVSLEVAAGRQVGIAAIGGYGSATASTGGLQQTFSVYEIGGQLRYYVTGAFERGLHLGVEALYVHVGADDIVGSGISGTGTGLGIGPLVGYKLTTAVGFTFEAQGGVAFEAIQAEAHDTADSAQAKQNSVAPIINLNIGWSF